MNELYTLSAEESHHRAWRTDIEPALRVPSESTVKFECQPGSGHDVTPETSAEKAAAAPFPGHVLTGPVCIEGAQRGDVLEIELLDIDHGDWGYTLVRPGEDDKGLLPEDFEDPFLYHWDLSSSVAEFANGFEIPIDPFPGTIGVAPNGNGAQSTIPPRNVGGNLDIKYLTEGASLLLPIGVDDAYFSIGDGHAAQGDGEVCVTAIETDLTVTTRLTLHSDRSIRYPQLHNPGRPADEPTQSGFHATVGVADSLLAASKVAVREMIGWLKSHYDLTPPEAYVLCSVTVDLSINELVNDPHWVVTAKLKENVLPG